MKNLVIVLAILLVSPSVVLAWTNADGWLEQTMVIPGDITLPSACADKQVFDLTSADSGEHFYICENGTWVQQGCCGGGGGFVAVPTDPTDTCTFGDQAAETGWLYTCIATDTWERVALNTWSTSDSFLLMETGEFILQEDNTSKIILEL